MEVIETQHRADEVFGEARPPPEDEARQFHEDPAVNEDIIRAEFDRARDEGRGVGNRGLTLPVLQSSLSVLGHNDDGEVVFTTATLNALSLNSLDCIHKYVHLQRIFVDNNALSSLAPLRACESLVLVSAAFNQLDSRVFEDLLPAALTLQQLDLSDNHLTTLCGVHRFPFLTSLAVNNNRITRLAASNQISNLASLSRLHLAGNSIGEIESGAFERCPLRCLDLSKNKIDSLAHFVPLAQTLTVIALEDNNVMHLTEVKALQKLHTLALAGNNIYEMHETLVLAELPLLRKLSLIGNPLCSPSTLPDAPLLEDDNSDIVRRDTEEVVHAPQRPSATKRSLTRVSRAVALEEPQNAAFVPLLPDQEDALELEKKNEEERYRLSVLWRVPRVAELDGKVVEAAESAQAKNLEGGTDRDARSKSQKSFLAASGSAVNSLRKSHLKR